MKKFLFVAFAVFASFAPFLHGQSVSPLVVECGKRCRGEFTVSNSTIQPLNTVVEPLSFSIDPTTGASVFRALDPTAEVTLDEMAVRIGPEDSHVFGYEIKCAAFPCEVAFQVAMTVGRTREGVVIRAVIPHIVYACEKAGGCRKAARLAAGLSE